MRPSSVNRSIEGHPGLARCSIHSVRNTDRPLAAGINSIRNTHQEYPQVCSGASQRNTHSSLYPRHYSPESFATVFSPLPPVAVEDIGEDCYNIASRIAFNDAISVLVKENNSLAYDSLNSFVKNHNTGDDKSRTQNHTIIQSLNIMLSLLDSCNHIDTDSKVKIHSDFNKFVSDFSEIISHRRNILVHHDADRIVEKKINSLLNKYTSLKSLPNLLMENKAVFVNAVNEKYVDPICHNILEKTAFRSQNEAEAQRIINFITDSSYAPSLAGIGAVSAEAMDRDNNLLNFHYFYNFFNALLDKTKMLNTFGIIKEKQSGPTKSFGDNLASVSPTSSHCPKLHGQGTGLPREVSYGNVNVNPIITVNAENTGIAALSDLLKTAMDALVDTNKHLQTVNTQLLQETTKAHAETVSQLLSRIDALLADKNGLRAESGHIVIERPSVQISRPRLSNPGLPSQLSETLVGHILSHPNSKINHHNEYINGQNLYPSMQLEDDILEDNSNSTYSRMTDHDDSYSENSIRLSIPSSSKYTIEINDNEHIPGDIDPVDDLLPQPPHFFWDRTGDIYSQVGQGMYINNPEAKWEEIATNASISSDTLDTVYTNIHRNNFSRLSTEQKIDDNTRIDELDNLPPLTQEEASNNAHMSENHLPGPSTEQNGGRGALTAERNLQKASMMTPVFSQKIDHKAFKAEVLEESSRDRTNFAPPIASSPSKQRNDSGVMQYRSSIHLNIGVPAQHLSDAQSDRSRFGKSMNSKTQTPGTLGNAFNVNPFNSQTWLDNSLSIIPQSVKKTQGLSQDNPVESTESIALKAIRQDLIKRYEAFESLQSNNDNNSEEPLSLKKIMEDYGQRLGKKKRI